MLFINEKNYKKIYKIFLLFFLCFICLERIMALKNFIPLTLIQMIYNGLALLGVLFILKNMYSYREKYKSKTYLLLAFFFIISALSCLINIKYGFGDNVKTLIWLAIQINLFYPATFILEKKEIKKLLYAFLIFIDVVWSIAIIVSIYQFIAQICFRIVINNYIYYQGFYQTRLFGAFIDPNFAGVMSFIFMIGNIALIKYKKVRYLSIPALIINFLYTILSGSRTVLICEVIVLFSTIFILLFKKYMLEKKSIGKGIGIFVISLLISFTCIPVNTLGQDALAQLPIIYKTEVRKNQKMIKKKTVVKRKRIQQRKNVLKREDTDASNISNNRFYIWKSYADTMKGDLLLGKSPRNAIAKISAEYPKSYIAQTKYETHNGYLSVFIYTGLLGSCAMILVLIRLFLMIMNLIFKKQYYDTVFLGSVMSLVVLLISAFFLTEVFFVNTFGAISFYLLMGYIEQEEIDLKRLD